MGVLKFFCFLLALENGKNYRKSTHKTRRRQDSLKSSTMQEQRINEQSRCGILENKIDLEIGIE